MKPVLLAMVVLLGVLWVRVTGDSFTDGTYTNRSAGFAIDFPSGFGKTDVPFSTFAVADEAKESTCVLLVQEVPLGVDAAGLLDNAEKRGRAVGYKRISSQPTRVGDVDGFLSESQMTVGGTPFRNTELHLVRSGNAVSVQCLAPDEDFDAVYLTFSRALRSFRWVE